MAFGRVVVVVVVVVAVVVAVAVVKCSVCRPSHPQPPYSLVHLLLRV